MSESPVTEKPATPTFAVQTTVRTPWRAFIDEIAPLRPDLHRYCCGLTGNVWDGEDLLQDTLLRVFGLLGKINADVKHPRAYLIRAATHLWIDRVRRAGVERAHSQSVAAEPDGGAPADADASQGAAVRDAACELFLHLSPQERAAVLLKDVLDFSLEETAAMLKTTVGAIKTALHRGRTRLQQAQREDGKAAVVPRELVDRFVAALSARDIDAIRAMCLADVTIEHVGGATAETFEQGKMTLEFAHLVLPKLGMGTSPRWETVMYRGEPIALGLRTVDGVEGLNEVWRLEAGEHGVERIRLYCFCPDLLVTIARDLGIPAHKRPYRSW